MNIARTIQYLFPDIDMLRECIVQDDGTGPRIAQWNRPEPQPTPAEIAAAEPQAEAAHQAARAARIAAEADKSDLRVQFQAAADDLQQIVNATFANNTQRDTAIKRMAAIQRQMLRALYGILTD